MSTGAFSAFPKGLLISWKTLNRHLQPPKGHARAKRQTPAGQHSPSLDVTTTGGGVCVCACACVCVSERERERERLGHSVLTPSNKEVIMNANKCIHTTMCEVLSVEVTCEHFTVPPHAPPVQQMIHLSVCLSPYFNL